MSTVTAADIRRHFPREVVDIVLDLVERGAVVRRTKAGHLNIRSSVNQQTMSVSRNSGSGRTPMHKVKQDALRLYPDFDQPISLTRGDMQSWDKDIRDIAIKAVSDYGWKFAWQGRAGGRPVLRLTSPDGLKVFDWTSETKPINPNVQSLRLMVVKHGKIDVADVIVPHDDPPQPEAVAQDVPEVLHVRPWLAKRSDGQTGDRRYESHAVLEREWTDGSLDYVCAYEDDEKNRCDYEPQEKPRSISAHFANRHSKGLGRSKQPSKELLIDTNVRTPPDHHREYSPRDDRVAALAEWLSTRVGDLGPHMEPDWHMVAKEALVWQHEQHSESEPREPETAEEILDKIRRLVDHGEYMRQQTRITEMEREMVDLREEAAACRARADGLAGNLGALKGLLADLDIESEGNPS